MPVAGLKRTEEEKSLNGNTGRDSQMERIGPQLSLALFGIH